jgi:tartrate/fumarate subfamily iron-sulfur-dependent hydro-lyase beta chain
MEYHFQIPVTKDQVSDLKLGDIVYLTGMICTGRDQVHKRILEYLQSNQPLPDEFEWVRGGAIYHMGPIVRELSPNRYEIVSGGPTTSDRMSPFQVKVCRALKIPFVIGKGGMNITDWGMSNAVYLAFPGGAGALAAKFLKDVRGYTWLDLGVPEAAWFIHVNNFGPLVVTIDSHGNSLYTKKSPSS